MCVQELEQLRDSLEEAESSTEAQKEIRAQRDNELTQVKKALEEEVVQHETAVSSLKQKYSKNLDDLNEQLAAAKKVQ